MEVETYVQPKTDIVGAVVVKASWQEVGRRGNKAEMYTASDGLFGTIPYVCSYEGVGGHPEVMSNILSLPRQEDIAKCY